LNAALNALRIAINQPLTISSAKVSAARYAATTEAHKVGIFRVTVYLSLLQLKIFERTLKPTINMNPTKIPKKISEPKEKDPNKEGKKENLLW
jgi:hypothetical protein